MQPDSSFASSTALLEKIALCSLFAKDFNSSRLFLALPFLA